MGGSFGALGGELSSLIINPAGIGVYRNSEFTFSTSLLTTNMDAQFNGRNIQDNSVNFNIPNIGFVNTYKGDANGWKYYSVGIGHNRINNFRGDYVFRGNNRNGSSFIDPYVLDLNESFPSTDELINFEAFQFGPAQAFYTFAIDTFRNGSGDLIYDRWLLGEESIDQNKEVEASGRQTETFASFGGNYQDKLFLGANIGVQGVRYEEEVIRTEQYNYATPPPNGVVDITEYRERTNLLTRGTGFNFKFGFIYRINHAFRIGGAIHSPTYFNMNDQYLIESNSKFSDGNTFDADIVESNYDYQVRTPMRWNASLAYVYGRSALLNFDYEYVDYSNANLDDSRYSPFDYSFTNEEIKRLLIGTHNFRFGTEIRLDPFVARAGFRYEGNPYSNSTFLNPDESRKTYSVGGGFRIQNFNLDLSYSYSQMNIIDPFYETSPTQANVQRRDHLITATVGWKW